MNLHILDGHAHLYTWMSRPTKIPQPGKLNTLVGRCASGMVGYIQQHRPELLCIVFDAPKDKLIKREMYPEYKSNRRVSRRDDQISAMDVCNKLMPIIRDMGVCVWNQDGYEGDDLINSTVKRFSKREKYDTIQQLRIVTGDKDLMCLVRGERVVWQHIHTGELHTWHDVCNKFGVTPRQMETFLALAGDSVDGIPGIHKVGPVLARQLLHKYGTLEEILENGANVPTVNRVINASYSGELDRQIGMVRLLRPKCPLKLKDLKCPEPGIQDLRTALKNNGLRG